MLFDISEAILARISHFTIGIVVKEPRKGSRVLGSGVLGSIEGRRGILTCGHVAEAYEKLPEIGLIRFVAVDNQRRLLQLHDTTTVILQSSKTFSETKEVLDLAFTALPAHVASSIEAQQVFLNMEKNRAKMKNLAASRERNIDVMLGLVDEFSQESFIEGKEVISPMRAVLHSGHIIGQENGLLTFKSMDYNFSKLPKSFGGMSGGGVWRIYFTENENKAEIVEIMLCGVASWQIDATRIACQGWDRIDQGLVPTVREKIFF
jgi:hypothetical protein